MRYHNWGREASKEMIEKLAGAGLNVARLNFSHGSHEDHRRTFGLVREVARERGQAIAILQDLQGPKIRVGHLQGGAVELVEGRELELTIEKVEGTAELLPHTYEPLADDVDPGVPRMPVCRAAWSRAGPSPTGRA
jgi:pyruvate kinase